MTKRQKFVLSSIVLSLGFIGINTIETHNRFLGIGGLSLATLVLFAWSLFEGLGLNLTLLVLVLPVCYTLGVGLFWFLLPATIFARIPIVIMYGMGIYALLLTSNIFTVSAIRTIALSRAARGVGFVLSLFASFLLYDAILSMRAAPLLNVLIVFLISFPIFLQGLWHSKLTRVITSDIFLYSTVFSYAISIIALLLYFWPVSVVVGSIFLTVGIYVMLGLGQVSLEGRLFKQAAREYLMVGVAVFVAMFLFTNWRG